MNLSKVYKGSERQDENVYRHASRITAITQQEEIRMAFEIPKLLLKVPEDLEICQSTASENEIDSFFEIRKRYANSPDNARAAIDKIRAFRLLKGMKRYIEIGTFDKSNLRYVMTLLDPNAVIVDLDIAENLPSRDKLESEKPDCMSYHVIVGDSSLDSTREQVFEAVGREPFNAVFIDANHVASYALTDFALYGELVSPDGYVFFHDAKWEGNESAKGVADAIQEIQKHVPVYQVIVHQPVSHWHQPFVKKSIWGGIAIVRGADLHSSLS